jgi:hypothetical protein
MSEKDFDKGYKSGFKFGKEVANEEWLDKVKQAREEIIATNDSTLAIVEVLDKLIAESEEVND